VPALVGGLDLPRELELGLVVSLVVGLGLVGAGLALLHSDRLLRLVGRLLARPASLARRRHVSPRTAELRLFSERERVAQAFAGRWSLALTSAAGNRMLDYAALVTALLAVGADASPVLVLLAYVGATILITIPLTPGGLGFVEAGLTGMLTIAGISPAQAALGTLLYRLASYWLPLPVGLGAWLVWRRRVLEATRADRAGDAASGAATP